jgi:hypothetical protein
VRFLSEYFGHIQINRIGNCELKDEALIEPVTVLPWVLLEEILVEKAIGNLFIPLLWTGISFYTFYNELEPCSEFG